VRAEHEEDFRQFVIDSRHRLVRTAYVLTGDYARAEDLVQTALVRTYRAWNRIERRDVPEFYARRIVFHLHASWWRRAAHRSERPVAFVPEVVAADDTEAVDRRDQVWRAVLTLPPRMRAIIVLRFLEDLKESETAEVLGCSVGTVKSQTSRALAKLRTRLGTEAAVEEAAATTWRAG
jgi:RNA polymerase sigma-70 factor (sigma-E family)